MTGLDIIAQVAHAHGVTVADLKARKRGPNIDAARRTAYRRLVTELGWPQRKVARYFKRAPAAVHNAIKEKMTDRDGPDVADYLLQQLNYISGQAIYADVASRLNLRPQRAIILAILMRASKPLSLAAISQLYDHVWQSLRDCEHFVCESTIKSAISSLRKDIVAQGLPQPIDTIAPFGYVLTEEFAEWASANLDIPIEVFKTLVNEKMVV